MSNAEGIHSERRPPIVLTRSDCERLLALLDGALANVDSETTCFLRDEIGRADVVANDVAPNSVVRMGCEVKFIDHTNKRIRHATLVFPEQVQSNQCISILSSIGSALLGLGPGQSIRWTEHGRERSLAVLEVRAGA